MINVLKNEMTVYPGRKILCFFGFHKWQIAKEEGCYGGEVNSVECVYCPEYIPHWWKKAKRIVKKITKC